MNLELLREHCYPDRAEGRLSIDGVFQCYTLEPPRRADNPLLEHPAIPAGEYGVTIAWSPKFNCMLPHVNQVPGRQNIEIHAGNGASDTQGCILVGQFRAGKGITQSRDAVHALMVKLAQVLVKDKKVTLTIEDPLQGELHT